MSDRLDLWRRRLGLWLPAFVFFALNLVAFTVYRITVVDEAAGLERRIEGKQSELAALEERRYEVEALVDRVETNRRRVEELYRDRFSTRRRRLTQVTEEVKSLARQAGLEPRAIRYPEEPIEDFALVERAFVFNVQGTYQELRTFINFLELTPSFITLKRVALTDGGESGLSIDLTLSTLFAEDEAAGMDLTS